MVTCAVRFMPTVRIHWCSYSREHCSMKANNVIHGGPTMFPVPSKLSGTFYLHKSSHFSTKKRGRMRCSLEGTLTPLEKEGIVSINAAEDLVSVTRFRMSDFELFNHVSIGLAGKGDEVIYEAIVKDCHSPLYNSKVVLRKLISSQAQRRGKRAIEVLKRLARRQLMYHSYAMQVHGYLFPHDGSFTLVHGYHGSYSLRHWLQLSDWLPTLEATLALDEESVRRVGDDTIGGPAVSRQLRIIRVLMRDLLIGVNYLHSHGLAHTELRLENVHISPVDRHIKVGILGKAADFCDNNPNVADSNTDRKQLMIAFDMRCVGFMMAKMVLRELMDPITFSMFKNFLNKGNDASCLREWFLPILSKNSPNGNSGLQMLDRNSGAGWHLLSLLLATKPSERISCLDALRHPFLCGPRWRVPPSMDIIRWGLGSTIVRITEEYIYGQDQRGKLAHFIELMEMLNPRQKEKNWLNFLPGKWRLLYSTGKHIGLTLRQPSPRVLIRNTQLTVTRSSDSDVSLSLASYIGFLAMLDPQWPHNKSGMSGHLQITTSITFSPATRQYQKEETAIKFDGQKWKRTTLVEDFPPPSLPILRFNCKEFEIQMNLDASSEDAPKIIREVRTQIPPEIFDVSKLICATYVDSRFLVLRGVNGSALIFTRSCANE